MREPAEVDELARLPALRLAGLSDADARKLLASVLDGPLDEHVRRRILAEARGNPLALLELPRELPPARLAGGFGLPGELPCKADSRRCIARQLVVTIPAVERHITSIFAKPGLRSNGDDHPRVLASLRYLGR